MWSCFRLHGSSFTSLIAFKFFYIKIPRFLRLIPGFVVILQLQNKGILFLIPFSTCCWLAWRDSADCWSWRLSEVSPGGGALWGFLQPPTPPPSQLSDGPQPVQGANLPGRPQHHKEQWVPECRCGFQASTFLKKDGLNFDEAWFMCVFDGSHFAVLWGPVERMEADAYHLFLSGCPAPFIDETICVALTHLGNFVVWIGFISGPHVPFTCMPTTFANITLPWLLKLCGESWNEITWVLQPRSSLSGLFSFFQSLSLPLQMLESIC